MEDDKVMKGQTEGKRQRK